MNPTQRPTAVHRAQFNRGVLAPIALFVYNRPTHLEKTVDSLRANDLAPQSDLFIYSDGPANRAKSASVQQVRQLIRGIHGFKSVTLIERERNWGLANSVIAGVTQVCGDFGRVIVMEDDLLTTPDFLTFMNQALDRYEPEPRIHSVSGFNFGLCVSDAYPYDALCFYRSSSLGWGTWKDRWEKADWTMSYYESVCADKQRQRQFNRGGEDLFPMLALQANAKIDSWAIRWAYSHFQGDGLALLSTRPLVMHIGSDAEATHSRRKSFRQLPLTSTYKSILRFPDSAPLESGFVAELQRLLRPSLARKLVRYLKRVHVWPAMRRGDFAGAQAASPKHSAVPEVHRR
jgi:hypothetical protein